MNWLWFYIDAILAVGLIIFLSSLNFNWMNPREDLEKNDYGE